MLGDEFRGEEAGADEREAEVVFFHRREAGGVPAVAEENIGVLPELEGAAFRVGEVDAEFFQQATDLGGVLGV